MLRIQAHYDRIQETDNHGWVYLVDAEGKEQWPQYEISFWDEEYTGSYGEYLYPITPEELEQYQFWGSFSAGDQLHKGEWEITFPLCRSTYTLSTGIHSSQKRFFSLFSK